jgi:acetylornithine deacetylase/succinyl-diaminopimelate desuccinylase-like protein
LKTHIEKQRFHLVDGAPIDENRMRYPKLASLNAAKVSAPSTAVRPDLNSPMANWLRSALTKTFGREPVQIRMMGEMVPTGTMVSALKVPFVIVPLVNADNDQHSVDENMRLGNYIDGVRGVAGILSEPVDSGK